MLPTSPTFPMFLSLTYEGYPISLILYASLYEGLVAHVAYLFASFAPHFTPPPSPPERSLQHIPLEIAIHSEQLSIRNSFGITPKGPWGPWGGGWGGDGGGWGAPSKQSNNIQ